MNLLRLRRMALYLFSTSNHNWWLQGRQPLRWLYTSFLHQTTTSQRFSASVNTWLYTSFLHQTTTRLAPCFGRLDGFIPLFYIKPQHVAVEGVDTSMALYLFSTSNHNPRAERLQRCGMALYLFSTSNHNSYVVDQNNRVWLYTSFLHQTTTWIIGVR